MRLFVVTDAAPKDPCSIIISWCTVEWNKSQFLIFYSNKMDAGFKKTSNKIILPSLIGLYKTYLIYINKLLLLQVLWLFALINHYKREVREWKPLFLCSECPCKHINPSTHSHRHSSILLQLYVTDFCLTYRASHQLFPFLDCCRNREVICFPACLKQDFSPCWLVRIDVQSWFHMLEPKSRALETNGSL